MEAALSQRRSRKRSEVYCGLQSARLPGVSASSGWRRRVRSHSMDTGLHLRARCPPYLKRTTPASAGSSRLRRVPGGATPPRVKSRELSVAPWWSYHSGTRMAKATLLMQIAQPGGNCSSQVESALSRSANAAGLGYADYLISANLGRTLQACRQAVMRCARPSPGCSTEATNGLGFLARASVVHRVPDLHPR